ncbi:MFS transporter [Nonomuraea sp. NPDC050153]|uniref:MFS transporter n=1 Tax=Nonomuraea sp. NPDC050153 TaxID=3364359 RepID=UPI0037969D7F
MTTHVTQRRLRPYGLVLFALIIAEATGAFEATMLTVAIPHLIKEFGATTTDVGWAVTWFLLVAGASGALGGRLGDLFGRRRVLIIVLALSILGSVISVAFGSFEAIIVGRAIQGVSGAVLPLLMGISREAVQPKRVPVTIAVVAGTVTFAAAIGYLVAGILVDTVGWEAIFIASGGLALLAAILCAVLLAPSPKLWKPGDRIDYVGGLVFVPALAILLYGVSSSRTAGWTSSLVLSCVIGGIVLAAFWVWWELRNPMPILNLRLLAQPKFALTMAMIAFFALGPMGGFFILQPVILQYPESAPVGLGLTASAAGVLSLVLGVFGYAMSPVAGAVASRWGAKRAALIGTLAATLVLPTIFVVRDNLVMITVVFFVMAVTSTFTLTSIPNLIAESVPQENMAEGSGFYVVVRSLFQAVSTSLVALMLSTAVAPGTQFPQVSAFGLAMGMMSVSALAGFLTVLMIRERRSGMATVTADGTPSAAPA